jgi:hypothetical protein
MAGKGVVMRKWILVSIALIAVLGGVAYAFISWQWHSAYLTALDKYRHLYDYRDSGVLLYEERLRDFETAQDRLERLPHPLGETSDKAESLRTCANSLRDYREAIRLAESFMSKDSSGDDFKTVMNNSAFFNSGASACIREAASNGDI